MTGLEVVWLWSMKKEMSGFLWLVCLVGCCCWLLRWGGLEKKLPSGFTIGNFYLEGGCEVHRRVALWVPVLL